MSDLSLFCKVFHGMECGCSKCLEFIDLAETTGMCFDEYIKSTTIEVHEIPLIEPMKYLNKRIEEVKKFARKQYLKQFPKPLRYTERTINFVNKTINNDFVILKKGILKKYYERWDVLDNLFPDRLDILWNVSWEDIDLVYPPPETPFEDLKKKLF